MRNGLTLAYVVALVNSALTLLTSFGVNLTPTEQSSIVGFVNVAIMLAARALSLPERTPAGKVRVTHVPVLENLETQEVEMPPPPLAGPPEVPKL